MIEGAIFDLDGTVLDSMSVWDTLGSDYLCSIGYKPKENLNEMLKSLSLFQSACYFKSEYGVTLSVEEIINSVNKMIENYYINKVQLKQGIEKFVKFLYQNNVKMCIATATDESLANSALKRCGIDNYFHKILTCTSIGHGKDEPYIYREALKRLCTNKAKTVVFEDAVHAIKTAKTDGFITTAIKDIHENKQEEIKLLADFYITDYSDINSFWRFALAL